MVDLLALLPFWVGLWVANGRERRERADWARVKALPSATVEQLYARLGAMKAHMDQSSPAHVLGPLWLGTAVSLALLGVLFAWGRL